MNGRPHTIVIDALSALQGGGQTYLINLFKFFPEALTDSIKVIAIVPAGATSTLACNDRIEYVTSPFASRGIASRVLWSRTELPRLLRKTHADVLFCPAGFVSVFGAEWKTSVTFQNMLPFSEEERRRYPYGYTRARLASLRYIQSQSFRKADLVFFISNFAKSIIDIAVGPRHGRSVVIPHGLNEEFRRGTGIPSPVTIPARYVTYVSTVTFYKAQLEVVRAWALMRRMRQAREKLLLIGPCDGSYVAAVHALIRGLGLDDEVILTGNVPYDALPPIYHGALANIFASSCENCPNILLEALAAGKPVLSSDYQPMPEFGGSAALYFDPYSPESLAAQLCRVLDDVRLASELGKRSIAHSAQFQWKTSAESTWRALADLAGAPCAA